MALVEPFFMGQHSCSAPRNLDQPLMTVATAGAIALCEPFLVKYNTRGSLPIPLTNPIDTVTTVDRFSLVEGLALNDGTEIGIGYRMLTPAELSAAMSFPAHYTWTGKRKDVLRQIGNAIPVQTAKALLKAMLRQTICK